MTKDPFFSNTILFNTYNKINPVRVLEYIKSHTPITIWDLSKDLEINRNTLYYFLRDLELTGVIRTKISINKKNRAVRLVYYNKKINGDKNANP